MYANKKQLQDCDTVQFLTQFFRCWCQTHKCTIFSFKHSFQAIVFQMFTKLS